MTMTRAFDELQAAGLGEIAMEGRERVLRFDRYQKKLWEKVRKFLHNPVKKRLWVKNFIDEPPGVKERRGSVTIPAIHQFWGYGRLRPGNLRRRFCDPEFGRTSSWNNYSGNGAGKA